MFVLLRMWNAATEAEVGQPLLLSPFCVFRLFRHDQFYVFRAY